MREKRYSSDLRARDWERIEPLIQVRRKCKWPLPEVVNGILYVVKNGCVWRDVPGDFPPWSTVYYYFTKWTEDQTWARINASLTADYRTNEKKTSFQASSSSIRKV